jgi:hypothetical protein
MELAWHEARTGERRGVYMVFVGNLKERRHLEDPGIDGRIISRRMFRKLDVEAWAGSIWLMLGTDGGHL